MTIYQVELVFTNLDNSLYTDHQAGMSIQIKSDDYSHAYLLAQRLSELMDADRFSLEELK